MLYRMRHKHGAPYLTGTWVDAQGRAQTLRAEEISLVPLDTAKVAGRSMPVRWAIKIPGKQLDIITQALNPNAWMDLRIPYWEGPVRLSGNQGGTGYLEMTGY